MGTWRKSSYSGSTGGQCVEVTSDTVVMVRATANRNGGTLAFTVDAWSSFMSALKTA